MYLSKAACMLRVHVLCFTCLHQANLTAKIQILGVDTIQMLPNFVTKLWLTLGEAARKICGMETPFCGVTFEIWFSHLSHPQNSSFLSRDPICSIPFYWATRGIKILMNMHLLKYWVNYKKPKILGNHCPKVQYCYLRQYYYLIIRSLVSWVWLIYLNS